MDSKKIRTEIIKAGEAAVKQLIKVAKEDILSDAEDKDIAADRLKNAAATKKLAIFDAFEILSRIESEKQALNDTGKSSDKEKAATSTAGFAERNAQ